MDLPKNYFKVIANQIIDVTSNQTDTQYMGSLFKSETKLEKWSNLLLKTVAEHKYSSRWKRETDVLNYWYLNNLQGATNSSLSYTYITHHIVTNIEFSLGLNSELRGYGTADCIGCS